MKKGLKRFPIILAILFILLNIISAFQAYKLTHFYTDVETVKPPEKMG